MEPDRKQLDTHLFGLPDVLVPDLCQSVPPKVDLCQSMGPTSSMLIIHDLCQSVVQDRKQLDTHLFGLPNVMVPYLCKSVAPYIDLCQSVGPASSMLIIHDLCQSVVPDRKQLDTHMFGLPDVLIPDLCQSDAP